MGKLYVRVDDRLIHGQIMAAWCNYLDIGEILGVDDKTAANPMLQKIMTMSVPSKYKCEVLTTGQAKERLAAPAQKNRLVILRWPQSLGGLREEIAGAEAIYLGNVAKQPESVYNESSGTSIFYLTQADVDVLDGLAAAGHKIVFQALPTNPEKKWQSFKH